MSGIGVLAVAGLNAPPIDACDDEKAKSDKKGAVASVGQVCPIYPYMFHGTWDSYYAMTQTADMPSAQCSTPRSLDAAHGLPLGCGGGGCARAMVRPTLGALEVDDEHDVSEEVDEAGAVDTAPGTPNAGASIRKRDDVEIEIKPAALPARKVWVRLFEIEFDPKLHDPNQPGLQPTDSAVLMTLPITTHHLGHEVRNHLPTTGIFGRIITAEPIRPVAGRKHVFKVSIKRLGATRTFTFLVKKF